MYRQPIKAYGTSYLYNAGCSCQTSLVLHNKTLRLLVPHKFPLSNKLQFISDRTSTWREQPGVTHAVNELFLIKQDDRARLFSTKQDDRARLE